MNRIPGNRSALSIQVAPTYVGMNRITATFSPTARGVDPTYVGMNRKRQGLY